MIENTKLSRAEKICHRKRLTKHLLLFQEGEEILRYSQNSNNSWNGGDYTQWLEYIQCWIVERSSCDLESGREMQAGGFLRGIPVIVTFYSKNMSVSFADESEIRMSNIEWEQIEWEKICSSDWGLHFNYKK